MLRLPRDILLEQKEILPDWIRAEPDFDATSFYNLTQSRIVFYPGVGTDGHALRLFGGTHSAHCFIHADFSVRVNDYGADPKGYRPIRKTKLDADLLIKELNLDINHPFPEHKHSTYGDQYDLHWASWTIFKRMNKFGESHGAEYLVVLHLCAEAVWVFWNIWGLRSAPPPYAILLQDHGFSGNWHDYGGGNAPLYKLALKHGCCPQWLLIGENTHAWPGYELCSQPDQPAGQNGDCRSLYTRQL